MKNVVDPEQAGNNVFSDPTAVRQAGKKNETKKVLVLPIPLHGALMEVAFREGVKLKTLVKESLLERIRQAEEKKVGEQDPCTTECIYDARDEPSAPGLEPLLPHPREDPDCGCSGGVSIQAVRGEIPFSCQPGNSTVVERQCGRIIKSQTTTAT